MPPPVRQLASMRLPWRVVAVLDSVSFHVGGRASRPKVEKRLGLKNFAHRCETNRATLQTSLQCPSESNLKMTDDNLPVHSFRTLLADLATITKNTVEVKRLGNQPARFEKLARPTLLQQRAFDWLGVKLVA